MIFQLLDNLALPDRFETIRNGFPVKFYIDIGRGTSKNYFLHQKIVKNYQNRLPDRKRPPASYNGDPVVNWAHVPGNVPDFEESPEVKWCSECSD